MSIYLLRDYLQLHLNSYVMQNLKYSIPVQSFILVCAPLLIQIGETFQLFVLCFSCPGSDKCSEVSYWCVLELQI